MRVCLMVEGQEGVSWEQWLRLAEACEAAGLDGLFRSDHYLSVIGRRERESHDALATLAGLAARTETIRLGTLVSPVTFRHPAVLAKSVATIDHISGGRVELGLGAGWNEPEHAAYGLPFPPLGERMQLLAEQLAIVKGLWVEDSLTFTGSHYRLDSCPGLPKPVQRPHPPIIVGGMAGPRSVELAVASADEYNTLLATVDDCHERAARLAVACRGAGRDPATLPLSLMAPGIVGATRGDVLARTAAVLARWGADDQDPGAALRERSERWIAGTVEEVASRLRALEAVGVSRVYLQHLAHDDTDMVELLGDVARAVSD